jgi:hypothetical protein
MEKNLYFIRYVVPLHDDKIGLCESVEVKDNQIIITFENPEITQWLKKKDDAESEIKFYYAS